MKYNRRNNKEEHRQMRAPVYEALETLKRKRVVPFDVPGHKRGRGNPELVELLGEKCVSLDVNSMKPLDNLCHPVSVIKEAEELAAEAFRAEHAFFMVGGTTSSVQGMVLSCCKAGDKIILPRNVHKSVINALVLCGAIPVYVNPERDVRLGISLGMERFEVEKAIKENESRKRKRGASTISQQTAKNVFLWPQSSWLRKGLEVYFTFLIETFWSKERIMEVYLNSIEMGKGIYGAQAAAQYKFNTTAAKLTKGQCALIAATLPNPIRFDSAHPSPYILKRQKQIMRLMNLVPKFPPPTTHH